MNDLYIQIEELLPNCQRQWILDLEVRITKRIYTSDLLISDIANEVGVSERQFYRKIKSILKITPNTFIQQLKMEKAKQLLEGGRMFNHISSSGSSGLS